MKTFELSPINGRKSFNRKAIVQTEGNTHSLISYNTKVAEYNQATQEMKVFGWYSATTSTHINSFLDYFGFNTCTKKQLQDYNK